MTQADGLAGPLALTDSIIAYEQGELDQEETIDLFQKLVDTGLVWQLQGSYGRTAQWLINAGIIQLGKGDRNAGS